MDRWVKAVIDAQRLRYCQVASSGWRWLFCLCEYYCDEYWDEVWREMTCWML